MRSKLFVFVAVAGLFVIALSAEFQITNTADSAFTSYGNGHKVAWSSSGVGHLIWVTHDGANVYALHYKRFYPATGWTADMILASMGAASASVGPHASIALDANDNDIHVVWTGYRHTKQTYYHVFYQKCVPGASGNGGWIGTPLDICSDHTTYAHCDPSVACAPGRVVVGWHSYDEDGRGIGFREYASNKWQTQRELEALSSYFRQWASVDVAANGDVAVAYTGTQAGQSNYHIYVHRRASGTWQAREDVTAGAPGFSYVLADVDFNSSTLTPHIVCHGWDAANAFRIYHAYRADVGWTAPEEIPGAAGGPDCDDVQPSLTFGANGTAYVVWYEFHVEPGIQRGILYGVCDADGGPWFTNWVTTEMASYAQWPNIAVAAGGTGIAVWTRTREPGSFEVWGRFLPLDGFGGQGAKSVAAVTPGLKVMPSPARAGRVAVECALPAGGMVSATVLDAAGRAVRSQQVVGGRFSLDLSGVEAGVYVIRLTGAGLSVYEKLVVQQ